MENEDIFEAMKNDVITANCSDDEKSRLLLNIQQLSKQQVNILITGATGCGKSSTINALFQKEVATVGVGVDPQTMDIKKYELKNMVLWDSPGLGDGKEADEQHARNIVSKLLERDSDGELLIDLVLVILDGSTRDLGTSYQLINEVIIPNLGENKENRILIAINQCDVAMKGKHWDEEKNEPDEVLQHFLDEKVASVKKRIYEGTEVSVNPIYYSAGYKEEGMVQCKPYNLIKLLRYMILATPKKKRLVYAQNVNRNPEMWQHDDELENYSQEINKSFAETFKDEVTQGAKYWGDVGGAIAGDLGRTVLGGLGAIGGGLWGVCKGIGNALSGGGCYITTATCEAYGKPDDCYELTAFRKFRDNWLKRQPDGAALIQEYYNTAPHIVKLIDKQPNKFDIYRDIRDNYLSKCLSYIGSNENEKCKELYVEMMHYLEKEKNNWQ